MRWEKRPVEVANLLNPAFCAVLLQHTVQSYCTEDPQGMDYLLAFLVLPLILHPARRKSIPQQTRVSLIAWAEKQRDVNYNLVEHVLEMVPFTKEALIFAVQQGVIRFGDSEHNAANLLLGASSPRTTNLWLEHSTADECRKKAKTVGDWFAEIGDSSIVYRVLDIHL